MTQLRAMGNVSRVIRQKGMMVRVLFPTESQVTTNSNKDRVRRNGTEVIIGAFPITFTPTPQQLKKVGIKQELDVLLYTCTADWRKQGIEYEDLISAHAQIKIKEDVFNATSNFYRFSQWGDDWLYIVIGGKRG